MAQAPTNAPKKERAKPKKRSVMVVMQMLDNEGRPVAVSKDNFRLLAVTRDGATALDAMEGHDNAFYRKVDEVS